MVLVQNEAGVVIYIDRQLAGPWGRDRHRYTQPPFDESILAGIRLSRKSVAPQEIYSAKALKGLEVASTVSQPLTRIGNSKKSEHTRVFELLRRNTH